MPTVIAIDGSLSMLRPMAGNYEPDTPEEEIPSRKTLAIEAINQFLDHISRHCKLEFVTLLTFSSLYEVVTSFGRDLEAIRMQLGSLVNYDGTNFETLLTGIKSVVLDTWGTTVPIQILLITDGSGGIGPGCLKDAVHKAKPFAFPAKMNVLSLSDPNEKNYTENCQMLQKLIDVACGEGVVYFPENHLTSKGCSSALSKLCAKDFTPYKGIVKCGQLSSKITLCPPPQPFVSRSDEKRYDFSDIIEVIGFIDAKDLSSPPAHSRHLLLPLKSAESGSYSSIKSDESEEDVDGRTPNFCVLLHGALKVDNRCALVEVGNDWYGFVYTYADNKKKSNLMLSILPPGSDVVPWLGNMQLLGPKDEFICKSIPMPSFPVKPAEKKSYGATPTVWITPSGINADVQKLLRHAKKLPEKNVQFYKELNRMRRWALTTGFEEVIETIAQVLERECMVLTTGAPEASIQLTHAAAQLRIRAPYSEIIKPQ